MATDILPATIELPARLETSQTRSRPKVLVVDSDRHVVDSVRFFLGEAGFATIHAFPGLEALALARRLRPQVVLAEVLTPELDGFSLCRMLKQRLDGDGIRVILFSSLAVPERAGEAGADAFLMKPVSESLLLNAVRSVLEPTPAWDPGARPISGWNV